jgi:hypothetical protein
MADVPIIIKRIMLCGKIDERRELREKRKKIKIKNPLLPNAKVFPPCLCLSARQSGREQQLPAHDKVAREIFLFFFF